MAEAAAHLGFHAIPDNFNSLAEVQEALRSSGISSSQLVIGIDYSASNAWTGQRTFGKKNLHDLTSGALNPYEKVVSVIAETLAAFDDDNLIPCYGFASKHASNFNVFSFFPGNEPAQGLASLLQRYRAITPEVKLGGPTSFAPLIREAMRVVVESGCQYHILLIVGDGEVTRSVDTPDGEFSFDEQETREAIVEASNLPLSIIMVGVGDGPWEQLIDFDDGLPTRNFDNFQFVDSSKVFAANQTDLLRQRAEFALLALMEIPKQYEEIQRLRLIGQEPAERFLDVPCFVLDPPVIPEGLLTPTDAFVRPSAPALQQQSAHAQDKDSAHAPSCDARSGRPVPLGNQQTAPPQHGTGRGPQEATFLCPITQETMLDPVVAADGHSYERASILMWLEAHDTSPLTGAVLEHKMVVPNHSLKAAIREFMASA